MKNPYDITIQNMLNEVYETGFHRVEWRHLYRWYGAERITDRIWDDLDNRFKEIDESRSDRGYRLGFLSWSDSGFITFICLDPEGTKPSEASFQPISAKKKK